MSKTFESAGDFAILLFSYLISAKVLSVICTILVPNKGGHEKQKKS